jgi:hypothetical protein
LRDGTPPFRTGVVIFFLFNDLKHMIWNYLSITYISVVVSIDIVPIEYLTSNDSATTLYPDIFNDNFIRDGTAFVLASDVTRRLGGEKD